MIVGGHVMIQSKDEAADKAFFRDVLKLPHVDAGGGFLLFALPPSEFAVHASDENGRHEFYLMCEDIAGFVDAMTDAGVIYSEPVNRGWGTMTSVDLPGGGRIGVYQPHHDRPHKKRGALKKAKRAARKAARQTGAARKAGKKAGQKKAKKKRARS